MHSLRPDAIARQGEARQVLRVSPGARDLRGCSPDALMGGFPGTAEDAFMPAEEPLALAVETWSEERLEW